MTRARPVWAARARHRSPGTGRAARRRGGREPPLSGASRGEGLVAGIVLQRRLRPGRTRRRPPAAPVNADSWRRCRGGAVAARSAAIAAGRSSSAHPTGSNRCRPNAIIVVCAAIAVAVIEVGSVGRPPEPGPEVVELDLDPLGRGVMAGPVPHLPVARRPGRRSSGRDDPGARR